jgi:hypothetical protein
MELWCRAISQPSLVTCTESWLVGAVGAAPWTTVHMHPVLHMLLVKAGYGGGASLGSGSTGRTPGGGGGRSALFRSTSISTMVELVTAGGGGRGGCYRRGPNPGRSSAGGNGKDQDDSCTYDPTASDGGGGGYCSGGGRGCDYSKICHGRSEETSYYTSCTAASFRLATDSDLNYGRRGEGKQDRQDGYVFIRNYAPNTAVPTYDPTGTPTAQPTETPSSGPSGKPSGQPTGQPIPTERG